MGSAKIVLAFVDTAPRLLKLPGGLVMTGQSTLKQPSRDPHVSPPRKGQPAVNGRQAMVPAEDRIGETADATVPPVDGMGMGRPHGEADPGRQRVRHAKGGQHGGHGIRELACVRVLGPAAERVQFASSFSRTWSTSFTRK